MKDVSKPRIGILLFNQVEVLDFAGPLEVFSCVKDVNPGVDLEIYTLGFEEGPVYCRSNLVVVPNYTLDFHPPINILLIPGGMGARDVIKNELQLQKIAKVASQADLVLSVCTGSLILAKLDLLNHKKATTHHTCFKDLAALSPSTKIITDKRFIDEGDIISAGGISAGIDLSLYVVTQLFGKATAKAVATEMEYFPKNPID